jgi:hypothetical protein
MIPIVTKSMMMIAITSFCWTMAIGGPATANVGESQLCCLMRVDGRKNVVKDLLDDPRNVHISLDDRRTWSLHWLRLVKLKA